MITRDTIPDLIETEIYRKKNIDSFKAPLTNKGSIKNVTISKDQDIFQGLSRAQIETVSKAILSGSISADFLYDSDVKFGSNQSELNLTKSIKFDLARSLAHANR